MQVDVGVAVITAKVGVAVIASEIGLGAQFFRLQANEKTSSVKSKKIKEPASKNRFISPLEATILSKQTEWSFYNDSRQGFIP